MLMVELNNTIAVTKRSRLSGENNTMVLDFTMAQYLSWKDGVLIQDAFPQLDCGEREFIKTGITPAEWASLVSQSNVGPNLKDK